MKRLKTLRMAQQRIAVALLIAGIAGPAWPALSGPAALPLEVAITARMDSRLPMPASLSGRLVTNVHAVNWNDVSR
jgi:hypothetical protein